MIEHNDSFRGQLVVKVIRPELVQNPVFQQRLKDALKTLRRSEKSDQSPPSPWPCCEQVIDGQIGERDAFLICDRLEGESLASLYSRQGRLGIADVRKITHQIAEALAAAHARNIVHGNLTPSHIMVARAGTKDGPPTFRVKVRNFGLARPLNRPDLFGNPSYLAPEQVSPFDPRPAATKETDLYTLALIVFELLAGRRAFPGDSVDTVARKLLREDPPYFEFSATSKREIERVNQVLQRAMRKLPSARFSSALEFAEALEARPLPSVIRPASGSVIVVLPPPSYSVPRNGDGVPTTPLPTLPAVAPAIQAAQRMLEFAEQPEPPAEIISSERLSSLWLITQKRRWVFVPFVMALSLIAGTLYLAQGAKTPSPIPAISAASNSASKPVANTPQTDAKSSGDKPGNPKTPSKPSRRPPPHPKKVPSCGFDSKISRELQALLMPCLNAVKTRSGVEVKFFASKNQLAPTFPTEFAEQKAVRDCLRQPSRAFDPLVQKLPRAGLTFRCQ